MLLGCFGMLALLRDASMAPVLVDMLKHNLLNLTFLRDK
jgi:hypothetical protein